MNDPSSLDADLTANKDRLKDEKLHAQLKIFWAIFLIVQIGLQALQWASGVFNVYKILYILIPIFLTYQIVIRKSPRFITWGLLYLLLITIITLIGVVAFIVAIVKEFNNIEFSFAMVPSFILIVVLAYQIWGVILHMRFRLE